MKEYYTQCKRTIPSRKILRKRNIEKKTGEPGSIHHDPDSKPVLPNANKHERKVQSIQPEQQKTSMRKYQKPSQNDLEHE